MKNSLQDYYESLVGKQSDSIQKFLKRNNLMDWEAAFSWFSDSDKRFIIKGYEKDIELRADYVFKKLCKNYRLNSIQSEKKTDIKKYDRSKDINDFELLRNVLMHSELLQLQNHYSSLFQELSKPAQKFLYINGIFSIEQLLPYIKGARSIVYFLEKCSGLKSKMAIYSMLQKLREDINKILADRTGTHREDKKSVKEEQNETPQLKDSISEMPLEEHELEHSSLFDEREILFNQLTERLSVRAKHILEVNGLTNYSDFVEKTNKPGFSFKKLKNCGNKTVAELCILANNLRELPAHEITQNSVYGFSNILINPMIKALNLSSKEKTFVTVFYEKHNYFPVVFLLGKSIRTNLDKLDYSIIEEVYNGRPNCELSKVERKRKEYIFENAVKHMLANTNILAWINHRDWFHYGIDSISPRDWPRNLDYESVDIGGRFVPNENYLIEENEYRDCIYEVDQDLGYTLIDDSFFEAYSHLAFIKLFFNMTCYWVSDDIIDIRKHYSFDSSNSTYPIFINSQFVSFNFSKALKEVARLKKIKTEEAINIPILNYFVDNEDYWKKPIVLKSLDKDLLLEELSSLFKSVCNVHIKDGNIVIPVNKMDYSERLYEILKIAGKKLHRDELFKRLKRVCYEKRFYAFDYNDPAQITPFLTRNSRIVPYGKSGFWGLKEWGEVTGSIRDIAVKMVRKSKEPIQIEDLANRILLHRPDSAFDNVTTIIRQSVYMGEFVLFFDDYIGLKGKRYNDKYVIYPTSFGTWVETYRQFVKINKRLPYCGQNGYEGYLYRWHYKASQLTDLSTEEILKFDALEKELAHYPQNATEYNFLQNCNLYMKFVESNQRMLTKEDDTNLFNWFYKYSRSYSSLDGNRNKYFGQLLQYISNILY